MQFTLARASLVVLLICLAGVAAPDTSRAGEVQPEASPTELPEGILPLSAVRPGMRGTARTVLRGTRLDTFEVEVLDVIHDHLTKQDVIFVRCLGEEIEHLGIAQGMSGSPVYIDGKLVGALAYTWSWTKEPLGGITPIEAMLAEGRRPLEGRPSGAEPETPLRAPRARRVLGGASEMTPIATPICASGFSAEGRARLAEALEGTGLAVPTGGGLVAGAPPGWANLDAPVVPGAAVTADLMRGDFKVSAVGTCTWVDGDKVYAFGHGFQDMGETSFPMSVAYIYGVIPSLSLSFKMGASIREIGALVQDRQSGIVGVLGAKAPMVPVAITLSNEGTGHSEAFHFEITANRMMLQRMLILAVREAFTKAENTLGVNTKRYRLEVKLKGVEEAWVYEDAFVALDAGFSRTLITLVDRVMNSTLQRGSFEWIKLDASIENIDRRAFIEGVTASRDEARPGNELELVVRMRKKDGGAIFLERMTVRIPQDTPPGNLVIRVLGGDNVPADVARPKDILDIPTLYNAFHKSTELVALIPTPRVNLDMDGTLYRNLPLSAVPRLIRSADATRPAITTVTEKVCRTVPFIVDGSSNAVVRILP